MEYRLSVLGSHTNDIPGITNDTMRVTILAIQLVYSGTPYKDTSLQRTLFLSPFDILYFVK